MTFRDRVQADSLTLGVLNDTPTGGTYTSALLNTAGYASYRVTLFPGNNSGGAAWVRAQVGHFATVPSTEQVEHVAAETYELKTDSGTTGSGQPAVLTGSIKGQRLRVFLQADVGSFAANTLVVVSLSPIAVPYDGRMRLESTSFPSSSVLGAADLLLYDDNQNLAASGQSIGYVLPHSGPVTFSCFSSAPAGQMTVDLTAGSLASALPVRFGMPLGRSTVGPFNLPRRQCAATITNTGASTFLAGLTVVGTDF